MRVGIITGSGTYSLPGLDPTGSEEVRTRWGSATLNHGSFGGAEVVHVSRHLEGHVRVSNHVEHRANVAALEQAGCDAVVAVTVCGAVDPDVPLGSVVVFDDLHFVVNRLPNGELCTFHDEPGGVRRGHWIFGEPYAPELRRALLAGAAEAGIEARDGGVYGHVDGPRFNTKSEIRGLAACGVTHVSQTAGPETVLCGEAELPFALLGFATDYANGVQAEDTPVDALLELIARSTDTFARVLAAAIPAIDAAALAPVGMNYRFHDDG